MRATHKAGPFLGGPICTTAGASPALTTELAEVTCRACLRAEIRRLRERGGDKATLRLAVTRLADVQGYPMGHFGAMPEGSGWRVVRLTGPDAGNVHSARIPTKERAERQAAAMSARLDHAIEEAKRDAAESMAEDRHAWRMGLDRGPRE